MLDNRYCDLIRSTLNTTEEKKTSGDKTVKEVVDSMTEEQKTVMYALIGQAINDAKNEGKTETAEEERIRYYADNVNYLTLNSFRYYANDVGYLTLNSFARNTIEKKKPDIFEVLDRLLFPCDPIRDWSEREVKKIDESFKPIEDLIDFAYS